MPSRRLIVAPPMRFWRTGTIAVVMAALGGARMAAPAHERPMQSRLSRYDVAQTALRIEATARRQGLGVFARLDAHDVLVLVLESAQGGTPVVMHGERSEVPLRLELRGLGDGASEVRFPSAAARELPAEVIADLASLPSLVADALG